MQSMIRIETERRLLRRWWVTLGIVKKTDPNAAEPNPNKVLWGEKVSSRAAALTFVRYGAIFSKCNLSAIQLCQSNRNQAQHQGYAAVPQHQ